VFGFSHEWSPEQVRRRAGRQRIIKLVLYIEARAAFAKTALDRALWIVSIKLIGQIEQ
jgi:hypothetical protein